jgi:glycosyltransferase involved in cell wall biosynthesis
MYTTDKANAKSKGAPQVPLKVLISAYACDPGKGSEPGVGWNLTSHVARRQQVWLLTRANNRGPIRAALAREPLPGLHVVYLDLPAWASFWKKGRRGIHLYYFLWQLAAYQKARKLHREVGFDLVHHLTFGIDWLPSFLALLPVPLIWGPLVGAQSAGKVFRRTFPWSSRIPELGRIWVRNLSRYSPLLRFTARRTTLALAAGVEAREHLARLGCREILTYPPVGISSRELESLASLQPLGDAAKPRFLCLGNLYAFRGLQLVLEALARVRRRLPLVELWIIGDGPERGRLKCQAERLGLGEAVKFWGRLPRAELLSRLPECSALVHICFRGAVSMACTEAMAARLPVICLDLGGPGLQVTEETGIKVPAVSPPQVVADLAAAMEQLAQDPALRARMGNAAREHVQEHFDWARKADFINGCYASVAASAAEKD